MLAVVLTLSLRPHHPGLRFSLLVSLQRLALHASRAPGPAAGPGAVRQLAAGGSSPRTWRRRVEWKTGQITSHDVFYQPTLAAFHLPAASKRCAAAGTLSLGHAGQTARSSWPLRCPLAFSTLAGVLDHDLETTLGRLLMRLTVCHGLGPSFGAACPPRLSLSSVPCPPSSGASVFYGPVLRLEPARS